MTRFWAILPDRPFMLMTVPSRSIIGRSIGEAPVTAP